MVNVWEWFIIGSREIKLSDRPNLPYTEAVLHEAMRLRTVAPLSIPHTTTCETNIGELKKTQQRPIVSRNDVINICTTKWT